MALEKITVYDIDSGLGGTHTVSIVSNHPLGNEDMVEVRIWYGRPAWTGWQPWSEFDGYRFVTRRDRLRNERTMQLFKPAMAS